MRIRQAADYRDFTTGRAQLWEHCCTVFLHTYLGRTSYDPIHTQGSEGESKGQTEWDNTIHKEFSLTECGEIEIV